jgi:type IV secretion system protein VirB11
MTADTLDLPTLPHDTTVREFMKPLQFQLQPPGVTEVCVNRPGDLWVEAHGRWTRHDEPRLTFAHCRSLAQAVATWTGQHTSEASPLLSATLPGGERVQFCQPGATLPEVLAICIRKPSDRVFALEDFRRAGLFERIRPAAGELRDHERQLLQLMQSQRYVDFLELAVRTRQTIVVAGKTGSGKTTLMKSLAQLIDPVERLVTIEDARELIMPHGNQLNLLYSKNAQGVSNVAPKQLLEACLRLRPDRILLAELRGEEAYSFLRNAASGHPGSLTSLHAGSAELAFDQIALMARECAAGSGLTLPEIKRLAHEVIDVVVHMDDHEGRHITAIHYEPEARLERRAA